MHVLVRHNLLAYCVHRLLLDVAPVYRASDYIMHPLQVLTRQRAAQRTSRWKERKKPADGVLGDRTSCTRGPAGCIIRVAPSKSRGGGPELNAISRICGARLRTVDKGQWAWTCFSLVTRANQSSSGPNNLYTHRLGQRLPRPRTAGRHGPRTRTGPRPQSYCSLRDCVPRLPHARLGYNTNGLRWRYTVRDSRLTV